MSNVIGTVLICFANTLACEQFDKAMFLLANSTLDNNHILSYLSYTNINEPSFPESWNEFRNQYSTCFLAYDAKQRSSCIHMYSLSLNIFHVIHIIFFNVLNNYTLYTFCNLSKFM